MCEKWILQSMHGMQSMRDMSEYAWFQKYAWYEVLRVGYAWYEKVRAWYARYVKFRGGEPQCVTIEYCKVCMICEVYVV